MGKVAGNEVRPGMIIELNGQLWSVVKTQSVKPGKGGTYNQVELKNVVSGGKLNERFRAAETVDEVQLGAARISNISYASGDMLTFMDMQNYDQIEIEADFRRRPHAVPAGRHEGRGATARGKPLGIRLPQQVVLEVVEADPVVRGQTASSSYKSATLENGMSACLGAALHRKGHER